MNAFEEKYTKRNVKIAKQTTKYEKNKSSLDRAHGAIQNRKASYRTEHDTTTQTAPLRALPNAVNIKSFYERTGQNTTLQAELLTVLFEN